mmetsp:Transcript_17426/g.33072  ORF Transcript_17426/g.33072 Transcript_17426/m.33072 type:complete len:156 (-) Transcript_17426:63-530(-)
MHKHKRTTTPHCNIPSHSIDLTHARRLQIMCCMIDDRWCASKPIELQTHRRRSACSSTAEQRVVTAAVPMNACCFWKLVQCFNFNGHEDRRTHARIVLLLMSASHQASSKPRLGEEEEETVSIDGCSDVAVVVALRHRTTWKRIDSAAASGGDVE